MFCLGWGSRVQGSGFRVLNAASNDGNDLLLPFWSRMEGLHRKTQCDPATAIIRHSMRTWGWGGGIIHSRAIIWTQYLVAVYSLFQAFKYPNSKPQTQNPKPSPLFLEPRHVNFMMRLLRTARESAAGTDLCLLKTEGLGLGFRV